MCAIEHGNIWSTVPPDVFAIAAELAERDDTDLIMFLLEHPFLLPLVNETKEKIAEFIGADAQTVVYLIRDPEIEDCDALWVWISSPLENNELERRFKQFENEWWSQNARRGKGRLFVKTLRRRTP